METSRDIFDDTFWADAPAGTANEVPKSTEIGNHASPFDMNDWMSQNVSEWMNHQPDSQLDSPRRSQAALKLSGRRGTTSQANQDTIAGLRKETQALREEYVSDAQRLVRLKADSRPRLDSLKRYLGSSVEARLPR